MKRLFFLSGLPRAGSTLVASLLRQNPTVHASIMSPVGQIVTDAVTAMGERNEARSFLDPLTREAIIRGIFFSYYSGSRSIVFDNNRRWLANLDVLFQCFPSARVLVCVRPIPEIVDSFERLFRKGALSPSIIHGGTANTTVFRRVEALMGDGGVVGFAMAALKDALAGPHRDRLFLLEYSDLAQHPEAVMEEITKRFHLPTHEYDFKNIVPIPGAAAFDHDVVTSGLHDLKSAVVYEGRRFCLPPEIISALPPPFWRPRIKEITTAAA